jgi:hypothetical protein
MQIKHFEKVIQYKGPVKLFVNFIAFHSKGNMNVSKGERFIAVNMMCHQGHYVIIVSAAADKMNNSAFIL